LDGPGGNLGHTEARQLVAIADRPELDGLHRARPDVEADDRLSFRSLPERHDALSSSAAESAPPCQPPQGKSTVREGRRTSAVYRSSQLLSRASIEWSTAARQ